METMTDIEQAATEAAEWFEHAMRGDDGPSFMRLKDGAPEWVRDLVHAAHGGDFLPDDWRYDKIHDALLWLSDGGDPEDGGEFADQAVDVYTGARFEWLASNLQRAGYVDDAVSEFGGSDEGIVGAVGLGQYAEASEIFALVVEALEGRVSELEASGDVDA